MSRGPVSVSRRQFLLTAAAAAVGAALPALPAPPTYVFCVESISEAAFRAQFTRLDILYGFGYFRPERACRVLGDDEVIDLERGDYTVEVSVGPHE